MRNNNIQSHNKRHYKLSEIYSGQTLQCKNPVHSYGVGCKESEGASAAMQGLTVNLLGLLYVRPSHSQSFLKYSIVGNPHFFVYRFKFISLLPDLVPAVYYQNHNGGPKYGWVNI